MKKLECFVLGKISLFQKVKGWVESRLDFFLVTFLCVFFKLMEEDRSRRAVFKSS